MIKDKYCVWCYIDGTTWALLSHRNKTEWSFKTAVKYAEEFSIKHKTRCKVVNTEKEPIKE